nr:unnamed protein product [Callosobruchus analis]
MCSQNTFTCVVKEKLKTTFDSFPNKKACGLDEVPLTLIKESKYDIAEVIASLVNLSVTGGVFPSSLKNALVVPIHKKGERDCIDNYRPISILSILSKIIEKLVYTRMMDFLELNNLLTS